MSWQDGRPVLLVVHAEVPYAGTIWHEESVVARGLSAGRHEVVLNA
jgi:hypothetical protein